MIVLVLVDDDVLGLGVEEVVVLDLLLLADL